MSRIVDSQERDTLIAKMSAGIDACLQLDIVKNLPDFLLPDGKGNVYSYASCDMTVIDNRLVNVISFRQNKGIKEPLYCGELYLFLSVPNEKIVPYQLIFTENEIELWA